MKRIFITTLFSFVSLASVLAFTADNIERIKKDMAAADVVSILGKPDRRISMGTIDGKLVETWKYGPNTEINFVGGKVESVLTTKNIAK